MYKRSSLQPILNLLKTEGILSPSQIAFSLGKSKIIIHQYLKALLAQSEIKKVGNGTHAKYTLNHLDSQNPPQGKSTQELLPSLDFKYTTIIDQYFLKFEANGSLLKGFQGFASRCKNRNLDIAEKAEQFYKIQKYIEKLQNPCGLLEVTEIFQKTVSHSAIDKLYYADQYKWMEFGRGKLAEITFYAKQSQNLSLLKQSLELIQNKLHCLIQKTKPDAIALTPHSIQRKNQILGLLHYELKKYNLPFIKLIKYFPNHIPIPQKSLKTREQRIQNARETILINDPTQAKKYKKTLLIDDFVGSGATINETAQKLKSAGCQHIIGFAFVGNANLSYEVINEI